MIIIVGASLSEMYGMCSKDPACASERTTMGIVWALWCVNRASVELEEKHIYCDNVHSGRVQSGVGATNSVTCPIVH